MEWGILYQKWLLFDLLLQDPWKWCQTCSDLNKKLHVWGCQHYLRQHLKWASFWIQVILSLNHEIKDTKIVFPALIRYLPSILPIIHPEISPKCNLRNGLLRFDDLLLYNLFQYCPINHLPAWDSLLSPTPMFKMNMVVLLVPPRHIVETFDGIRCPSPTRSAQEFQGHQADAGPGDPSHALVVVAMACTNERKQKGHAVMKIKDKANNEMISFVLFALSSLISWKTLGISFVFCKLLARSNHGHFFNIGTINKNYWTFRCPGSTWKVDFVWSQNVDSLCVKYYRLQCFNQSG